MMRRPFLLRSLLARNIALLVVLLALTQIVGVGVLVHFVQAPRVERAAAVFASYVRTLDGTLSNLSPAEAHANAERLGARPDAPDTTDVEPAPPRLIHFFQSWQRDVFFDTLQRDLPPDMPVRWDSTRGTLWIRVHFATTPMWVSLAVSDEIHASGLTTALVLSGSLALLAALAGYLIQLRISRPLADLAHAARRVSSGEPPAPLPIDGPTEINQVSIAFNQMTDALKQAEATRALMLAGVSHDIRTPLTKLRLAMAMAGADANLVASAENYLDHIDTILQQFMDYAGSGEREAPQTGDLNGLISQLAADFAGLGHEFELSLGKVPHFAFRPVAVMRVLMNLMQNATVYGKPDFTVRTWIMNGHACVAIGDRGDGISAEALEKLKAPFSRGQNARSHTGGTGLGLAIVERIARLHGGTLHFTSREGGGLEARVTFALSAPVGAASSNAHASVISSPL